MVKIPKDLRAVILDLDGTLIDTAGEIAAALERAFAELGVPALPHDAVAALIGRGVQSLVERALAQSGGGAIDRDEAVARFESHYARTVATEARLFAGVLEGLRLLHVAGFRLGVVTNKPRFFTERLLKRAKIDRFFVAVVAGDDAIRRKPHGDMLEAACRKMDTAPGETLVIGDSDNNVEAARAAGCPVWCVPYGYNAGCAPESLACDRLVATVEEAARMLAAAV